MVSMVPAVLMDNWPLSVTTLMTRLSVLSSSLTRVMLPLPRTMALSKVSTMLAPAATAVASSAGLLLTSIGAVAITDVAGNAYAGISDADALNFATAPPPDTTAPMLVSSSPADDATAVAAGANIVLTFDSAIVLGSGNITLVNDDDNTDNRVINVVTDNGQLSINTAGTMLTINPTENLVQGNTYHLEIAATAITDVAGNAYAGISDADALNFATAPPPDTTAPMLVSSSPADDATAVAFDSAIVLGSGNITLVNDDDNTDNRVINVVTDNGQLSINTAGTMLTINPTENLVQGNTYHLEIAATAITDVAGNAYAGISDADALNFATAPPPDTTAPMLVSSSPADDATAVAAGANIVLTFDSAIVLGSGNITLVNDDDNTDNRVINVVTDNGQLSINTAGTMLTIINTAGTMLTINPTENLVQGNTYHLEIAATAITDVAGNAYAGISDADALNFATAPPPDTTAPMLVSSSPADDATAVAAGANIVLTFDSAIVLGSGNITLVNDDDNTDNRVINVVTDNGQLSINTAGTMLTINPTENLVQGNTYHLEIAATAITDVAGNAYAGISDADALNFATAPPPDTTAPMLVSSSPADDATAVAAGANIVLTFDSAIVLGSGNITLVNDDDNTDNRVINVVTDNGQLSINTAGTMLTINPTENLVQGNTYHLEIAATAITDVAGNAYAGISDADALNFATAPPPDTTAPMLVSSSPADDATAVAAGANIVLTFDSAIVLGSGNITLVNDDDNTDNRVINVVTDNGQLSINTAGTMLTINPTENLVQGNTYHLEIAATAITDVAGNDYAGISDADALNFETAIDTSTIVFDLTTGLSSDHSGQTFAADVTYTIYIRVDSDSATVALASDERWAGANNLGTDDQVILVGDGSAIFGNEGLAYTSFAQAANVIRWISVSSDNIARLNPDGAFTRYYSDSNNAVNLWDGTVTGISGNHALTDLPAGVSPPPPDTTAPMLSSSSPADDATAVAAGANLVLTFDSAIVLGSGNITLVNDDDNTDNRVIDVAAHNDQLSLSSDGTMLIINPTENLVEGNAYHLEIAATAITDVAGNDYAGIDDAVTLNFATAPPPDTIAPLLSSHIPADNAEAVAPGANLVLTFDSAIVLGSGNITLVNDDDNTDNRVIDVAAHNDQLSLSSDGTMLIINPTENLVEGNAYHLEIAATAITDVAGNDYAGIDDAVTLNFATAPPPDTIAPLLSSHIPADNATAVAAGANLVLTFDSAIVLGSGNITLVNDDDNTDNRVIDVAAHNDQLSLSSDGTMLIINPTENLVEGNAYHLEIAATAITDVAGNDYAGIDDAVTLNFATAPPPDTIAPLLSSHIPADNAEAVAPGANLVLTFDSAIVLGSGNITLVNDDDNTDNRVIDVAAHNDQLSLSSDGTMLIINPTENLVEGNAYHLEIAATAITDVAGNDYAGIDDAVTLNFATAPPPDTIAPLLSSHIPADNATAVAAGANLVLTFDSAIVLGSGNITLVNDDDNTDNRVIDVAAHNDQLSLSSDGTMLIINPTENLVEGNAYHLEIAATAITDVAGNDYAGIDDAVTLNFATAPPPDTIAPLLSSHIPADNAEAVAPGANLVLTFDSAIVLGSGNITLVNDDDNTDNRVIDVAAHNDQLSLSSDGTMLIINPTENLVEGNAYHLEIAATAITDVAGNDYAGIDDAVTLNFATAPPPDTIAPLLSSHIPADNATAVAAGANLVLTFDSAIVLGSGNITLVNDDDNTDNRVIDVAAHNDQLSLSSDGTMLIINPTENLVEGNAYHLEIAATAITDVAGNDYAGIDDAVTLNFATAPPPDTIAPLLSSHIPADNAEAVAPGANLVLTFDSAIVLGSGNITLVNDDDNTDNRVIDVAAHNDQLSLSSDGTMLIINPTENLVEGNAYHLEIAATAITDVAGNDYAGISDADALNFATAPPPDTTAPMLLSHIPADNATAVAAGDNLVLTFDSAIVLGSGNITLVNDDDNTDNRVIDVAAHNDQLSLSSDGTMLIINPTENLVEGNAYHLEIAATAITDVAGNDYAGIDDAVTLNFATAPPPDTIAPLLSSHIPADNAEAVAPGANLVLTFDSAIVLGSGNITLVNDDDNTDNRVIDVAAHNDQLSLSSDGTMLIINPTENLVEGNAYHLEIAATAITDVAGNDYAGISDADALNFATAPPPDTTAPMLLSHIPADNATAVAAGDNLVLTFDSAIVLGSGNITLVNDDDNTDNRVIDVTADNGQLSLSSDGTMLTINPTENLVQGNAYHLEIAATAITDVAGNDYVGISDADAFNFATAPPPDTTAPMLLSHIPADNATAVAAGANLVLTFDSAIVLGSGNITLVNDDDNTDNRVIDVTADNGQLSLSSDGTMLIINPTENLVEGNAYHLEIAATAITDVAGNDYAGIDDAVTLNFATAPPPDTIAPLLSSHIPADNATAVAAGANLVLTFDSAIVLGSGNITLVNDDDNTDNRVIDVAAHNDQLSLSSDGTMLIINPTENLVEGNAYHLEIAATAITDVAGNDYAGIDDAVTLNFATAPPPDTIAPLLSSHIPADNAEAVAPGANLVLTFDSAIVLGSGNITLVNDDDNTDNRVIDVAAHNDQLSLSSDGTMLIINPTENLVEGNAYHLEIAATAITDVAGNDYAGIDDAVTLNFATAPPPDTIAPLLSSHIPADNATAVAAGANLVLTFDSAIVLGSGNITLVNDDDNTDNRVIDVAAHNDQLSLSSDGTMLIINPTENLVEGNAYHLEIAATAITDVAGNDYAGIDDAVTLNFATAPPPDTIAPLLSSHIPADNAEAVAPGANLVLTFDSAIVLGSGNITLVNDDDNTDNRVIDVAAHNDQLSLSSDGTMLIINPTENLVEGNAYHLEIAATAITDVAGNDYAGIDDAVTLNFATAPPPDTIAPLLSSHIPADNATAVAAGANLVLTFDSAIVLGSGNITLVNDDDNTDNRVIDVAAHNDQLSLSSDGTMLIINPTENLVEGNAYHLEIAATAITDVAGNDYAGIDDAVTLNFATAPPPDTIAPLLSSHIPADNAEAVAPGANLVLTFDSAIVLGSGNITLVNDDDNTDNRVIDVAAHNDQLSLSSDGTMLIINPTENLVEGNAYHLEIAATAITDVAGNDYAGIDDAVTLNFATAPPPDTIAPLLSSHIPADNATAVAAGANLVLTFDSAIVLGSGNITLVNDDDNTDNRVIDVAAHNDQLSLSSDGTMLIINPTENLVEGNAYHLEIAATAITDVAGNDYAGIDDAVTLNFATAPPPDTIAPLLSSHIPADNAEAVAPGANLVLTFDSAIVLGSGNITLVNDDDNTDNRVIDVAAHNDQLSLSSDGTMLIINPTENLVEGNAYHLEIAATAITDVAGNDYAGIDDAVTLNFATAPPPDTIAPLLSSHIPADNATAVAAGANLVLTFDSAIVLGSGNITLVNDDDNTDNRVIDVAAHNDQLSLSSDGTMLIINPTENLVEGNAYHLEIAATAITDVAGNDYAGIDDAVTLNFATAPPPDTIAPLLSSHIPADNAEAVAPGANLVLTFDSAIVLGSGNITLVNDDDNTDNRVIDVAAHNDQLSLSSDGTMLIINPTENLVEGNAYHLEIAATAITDVAGNDYAGIDDAVTLNFATAPPPDTIAPLLSSHIPADNATAVAAGANLVLTFDSAIVLGSGNITLVNDDDNTDNRVIDVAAHNDQLSLSSDGTMLIINPTENLVEGNAYHLEIAATAITDVAGNDYAGIDDAVTLNFATAPPPDTIAPLLSSHIPADNAEAVAPGANLVLTFDSAIVLGSGNITLVNDDDNTDNRVIDVAAHNDQLSLSSDGTMLIINPTENLVEGNAYHLEIAATAITDVAGNDYAGIDDAVTLNFATAPPPDTIAPLLSSHIPADNATAVAAGANLVLTFDSAIVLGSGNITLVNDDDNTDNRVIDVAAHNDQLSLSSDGTMLIINPTENLVEGNAYHLEIAATAITDVAGNDYAGIDDAVTLNFATAPPPDTIAPLLSSHIPADNAEAVAPGANLVLTFDSAIVLGSGNITLVNDDDNTDNRVIDVAAHNDQLSLSSDGTMLIINPTENLVEGNAYHLEIAATAITDVAGNDYAGIDDAVTLNFATAPPPDTIAPLLSSHIPADNATAVAPGANLVLTFDSAIVLGSGNITLVNDDDNTDNRVIDVAAHNDQLSLSSDGTMLIINPTENLVEGNAYHLEIAATAITDVAGNDYAGIDDAVTLNFATAPPPDTIAPLLSSHIPADNAEAVAPGANLVLTFDSAIVLGSGNITLVNDDDNTDNRVIDVAAHNDQLSLSSDGTMLIINPTENLVEGNAYHLEIAATAITDVAGNDYAGIDDAVTLNFATAPPPDTIAPLLSSHIPADNATAVAPGANLVLTFDSAIVLGSGNITLVNDDDNTDNRVIDVAAHNDQLSLSSDGTMLIINPTENLVEGNAYHLEIAATAITDVAGNDYAGIDDAVTLNFATAPPPDTIAPLLSSHIPADNATAVAPGANLVLTFDSAIVLGSGNITLVNDDDNTDNRVIDVAAHNDQLSLSSDGTMLIINPTENLVEGNAYHLEIAATAITDVAGNDYAGIDDAVTLNFATAPPPDTIAPLLSSHIPADNAEAVAPGANLVLTFDSAIVLGSGNITLVNDDDNTDNRVIDVAAHNDQLSLSSDGTMLIINPTENLVEGNAYHLEIAATAITDVAGNDYAGIDDAVTLNFATAPPPDTIAPLLSSHIPADNATAVAPGANLVLTFDSAIVLGSGNITLVNDDDNTDNRVIDVAAHNDQLSLSSDGTMLIINPTENLVEGNAYHLEIAATAITDVAGNDYAGIDDAVTLNFATAPPPDTIAPLLSSHIPADNATAVAAGANLVLTFDSAIVLGSGNITLVNDDDNTDNRVIDVAAHNDQLSLSSDGTMLIINPTENLVEGNAYHLEIAATAITDVAGNDYAGIDDAVTLNFATAPPPDTIAPLLSSHIPADNAEAVAPGANLVLTFDSAIVLGSGNITLVNDDDNTDNRVIDVAAHNDQLSLSSDGTMLIINPTENLVEGNAYHLEIAATAITDVAGNDYAGIDDAVTLNFATAPPPDTIAPLLSSHIPADNADAVAAGANLVLTFDSAIVLGSGTITLVNDDNPNDNRVIDVEDHNNQLSINTGGDRTVLTINPSMNLAGETGYHLEIESGAITDEAGNPYGGIAAGDTETLNFETAIDTSTIVFDLTTGLSSDHSGQTFADDVSYTIYIRVDSDSADITLHEGERWTVANNLGTDDQVILVGDGSAILGKGGNAVSRINNPGNGLVGWHTGAAAGAVAANLLVTGRFERAYSGAATEVDLWTGIVSAVSGVQIPTPLAALPPSVSAPVVVVVPVISAVSVADGTHGISDTVVVTVTAANNVTGLTLSGDFNGQPLGNINNGNDDGTYTGTYTVTPGDADVAAGGTVRTALVLTDAESNASEVFTEVTLSEQSIIDANAPTVTGVSVPEAGTYKLGDPLDFTVQFSEAVSLTAADSSGNIASTLTLSLGSNTGGTSKSVEAIYVSGSDSDSLTYRYTVAEGDLDSDGLSVEALALNGDSLTDASGNAASLTLTNVDTSEVRVDGTAPMLSSSIPADDADAVAAGANIVLTFDSAIVLGSGTITLVNDDDNTDNRVINVVTDSDQLSLSSDGTMLTINPTEDLVQGSAYHLEIAATAITDVAGNAYAGISDADALNFATADTTAPMLLSHIPADDADAVAAGANLVLTFDSAIVLGSGNITLVNDDDNTDNRVINVVTDNDQLSLSSDGTMLTINPTDDLVQGSAYHLEIAATAITDVAGNNYAGISTATALNFATADTTAPMLLSSTPADGADAVAPGANLVLTFDSAIVLGSGTITLVNDDDDTDNRVIDVTAHNDQLSLSSDGTMLTINPTENLVQGNAYHLEIAATAITDVAGNDYAGISDADALNFATAVSTVVFDLTTGLSSDHSGQAFVDGVTYTIYIKVDSDSHTLTLDSGERWAGADNLNTDDQIILVGDGSAIIGNGGNVIVSTAGAVSINWMTTTSSAIAARLNLDGDFLREYRNAGNSVDLWDGAAVDLGRQPAQIALPSGVNPPVGEAPVIRSVSVADGAYTVGDTVLVTVTAAPDTEGNPATGLTLSGSFNGRDLTNIDNDNDDGTYTGTYTVIGGDPDVADGGTVTTALVLTDTAANRSSPTSTTVTLSGESITGTPQDTTAPLLLSHTPADDATAVAAGANIVLTFDSAIALGSGSITLVNADNPDDNRVIDVTAHSDQLSINTDGTVLTINPSANLAGETGYHLEIESGAITDVSGNPYGGIAEGDTETLNFETAIDTSTIVFDLTTGLSSDHSGQTFAADTTYTIYIRVDSDSADITLHEGERWTVANNLGTDDQLILVGDGSAILGKGGNAVSRINDPRLGFIGWHTGAAATAVAANLLVTGRFERAYSGAANDVDLWSETVPASVQTPTPLAALPPSVSAPVVVVPVISAVSVADGTHGINETVVVTVTAANNVTGLTLSGSFNGQELTNIDNDNTDGTYTGTYTVTPGDADVAAGGTVRTALVLTDAEGNASEVLTEVTLSEQSIIDANAPTVTAVSIPAAGTYGTGDTLDFTVQFSEAVSLTAADSSGNIASTLTLSLGSNTGGTGKSVEATYVSGSGSGSNSLTYRYTVAEGDLDRDGLSVDALALNGDRLADASGNDAILTLTNVDTSGVQVDGVAPLLSSSSPDDNADAVAPGDNLALTFDSAIAFGSGSITLVNADNPDDNRVIDVTAHSDQLSINSDGDGQVLTIDPSMNLAGETGYHLEIESGAITDVSGNPYGGIAEGDTETLNFETAIDTSTIVFDLTTGLSSDHSGQTFAADVSYTLYIKVGSSSADITLHEGERWTGANHLGTDDQLILVGDGSDILGNAGLAYASVTQTANVIGWISVDSKDIARLNSDGAFTRFYNGANNTVDLWDDTVTGISGNAALTALPPAVSAPVVVPIIESVTLADGSYKTGDRALVSVTAAPAIGGSAVTGLTLSGDFNGQPLSNITDNGDGTYSGIYTVTAGDSNVAVGGTVSTALVLTDADGNASEVFSGAVLSDQSIDTTISTVVFDLTAGLSSDHSSQAFVADISYTLYIKVDSDSEMIALGSSERWTGANNLSTDDQVILVGDGSAILGFRGDAITNTDNRGNPLAWTNNGVSAAALVYNGAFTRFYNNMAENANLWDGTAVGLGVQPAQAALPPAVSLLPFISDVSVPDGNYKAGDTVLVTVTAGNLEIGLTLSGSFNSQPLTDITDNNNGTYTGTYTVTATDPEVGRVDTVTTALVLTDAAGNASPIHTEVSFNGNIDATAPILRSTSPADNDTAVAVGSDIVLNFDDPITLGSGTITLVNDDNPSDNRVIDVGAHNGQLSPSGNILFINPSADLDATSSYYLTITPGAITNVVGNNYEGISNPDKFNFTTGQEARTVVFDLTTGFSSDRDNQTFAADVIYTLYIKVDSDSATVTLKDDERWSGAGNLGTDDQLILVGDGSPILGNRGGAITITETFNTIRWVGGNMNTGPNTGPNTGSNTGPNTGSNTGSTFSSAASLRYNGEFVRFYNGDRGGVDLWEGTLAGISVQPTLLDLPIEVALPGDDGLV